MNGEPATFEDRLRKSAERLGEAHGAEGYKKNDFPAARVKHKDYFPNGTRYKTMIV